MRNGERMTMALRRLIAAVLICACLCGTALAGTYPYDGVINADTNMRSAPKSNVANVIMKLKKGDGVEVLGATGNFYRIMAGAKTGYVFKQYVDRGTASSGNTGSTGSIGGSDITGNTGIISGTQAKTTDALRLRATASTSGKVLLTIPKGAMVTILQQQGKWLNVTYGGQTGWCHSDYVNLRAAITPTPGPVIDTGVSASGYIVLQSGADSDHVIALQEALIELGYLRGTADGVYGAATAQAVMALQRQNDYPITGIADANLQAFIFLGKPQDATGEKISIKTLSVLSGQNVRYGDKGLLVRTIQSQLEKQGYLTNNVTGTYDNATTAAVKAFQQKNNLKADGVCGEDTQKLLFGGGVSANGTPTPTPTPTPTVRVFEIPTATVKKGSKGNNAVLVQARLIELGYLSGAADGQFGSQSVAALKAFQQKNGLKADGVAGSGTYEVLFSVLALGVDFTPVTVPPSAPVVETTYPPITTDNVVVIKQGVTGEAVKRLQARLTELGYYESVQDGKCKADDVAAIRAFQRKNGLTVDGVAGYDTQSILYTSTAIMDNGLMAGALQSYTLLKKGMTGAAVQEMQKRLITLKYLNAVADGIFGTDTAEAVYNFQKRNGLVRDGIAGEKTLQKLYSTDAIAAETTTPAPSAPTFSQGTLLQKGDEGALVVSLQDSLIRLGYLSGTADGIFGVQTYQAVKKFQAANALYADGIAGDKTFAALNIAGTGNNGSAGNTGGSTAPTVTDAPNASTGVGVTVEVSARNVVYEYWYSTVRNACRQYPYATVYDYQTGISWQVNMFSYGKHAEAEPLTAADTAKMEQACGGNKWTPRPVWVIFADGTIRMATTHSVPHQVEHIKDNDFPGHTCIHFPRTMAQVTAIGPYATRHQNTVDKAWAEVQAMIP